MLVEIFSLSPGVMLNLFTFGEFAKLGLLRSFSLLHVVLIGIVN